MKTNGHSHSERCHDYIKCLEEERRKIQVFQRELPLCMDLITRAIESCKGQLSGTSSEFNWQGGQFSECSEHTSSFVPVLEEFIPLKGAYSDSYAEQQESERLRNIGCNKDGEDDSSDQSCKKSEWLRSVQLWNQTPDPISEEAPASKFVGSEVKINEGGAFHPFIKEKSGGSAPPPSTAYTAETGGENKKEGQPQRKTRRAWSPELHRTFLQALKQLGGPHVATPKQIREFMKVDGLTNDEVKSHLQKYRLHTRRPSPSTSDNNAQITPQFVVVGGIWVPPEYANAMATTTTSEEAPVANKIYAPVAAPPQPFQRIIQQSSHSPVQSCSLASSSSTHTAAVSSAC